MKAKQSNKQISIWYNENGVDECLVEGRGELNLETLNRLGKEVHWLDGWSEEMFEELYVEQKGRGWVMMGFDGIGVFVVDANRNMEMCKGEYDRKLK